MYASSIALDVSGVRSFIRILMLRFIVFLLLFFVIIIITGHFSALARLINLLRRAGKLDECSKYLEQVGLVFVVPLA